MNERDRGEKESWNHNIAQSTLIKRTWTNKNMLSFKWRKWKGEVHTTTTSYILLISNASTNGMVFKNGVDIVTLVWLAVPSNCKLLGYSGTLCTLCTVCTMCTMQFHFRFARNKWQSATEMKSEISTDEKKEKHNQTKE